MNTHADGPPGRGGADLFAATRWSLVLRARDESSLALNELCGTYWEPLRVWLQSNGQAFHDAEDLIQGFFAQLLTRDFLRKVGPEHGCFRAFLLQCLKNFVRDQRKKGRTLKRGGGRVLESLEEPSSEGNPPPDPAAPDAAPDKEYHKAWARTLLAKVLKLLEVEWGGQGRLALFQESVPVLFADETASSYPQIARKLDLTEEAVKSAALRLRRRLKKLVQAEVRQTVTSEKDFREELRFLMGLFK